MSCNLFLSSHPTIMHISFDDQNLLALLILESFIWLYSEYLHVSVSLFHKFILVRATLLFTPYTLPFYSLLIACYTLLFNPFVPRAPFLYPLKPSENLTVFLCFRWVGKGCIGNEWVNCCPFHSWRHLKMIGGCYWWLL